MTTSNRNESGGDRQHPRQKLANVERLHRLMDEEGISAIVARSGKNFTYLAGFAYPGTLARHLEFPDSPREVMLVWPRTGEPVMVLNSYAAPLARRDSWLERIEVVDDYAESPYQRAADVLRQLGLAEETIGFEKSYVSANRWEEIGGVLPKARIVDSTELMDRVRWIKTPEEVAALEAGARLLDEAYLEVLPTVRPGDTERLVHSRIIESCLRRGANWAHGILNSSRNTVAYGGESDLAFEAGDIVRNDYVSYLNGYPGHQSRSVCVGPPSDEQKRIYEVVRDIYRATIERCRPGTRTKDIYHFANDSFHEAGFPGQRVPGRAWRRSLVAPAGAVHGAVQHARIGGGNGSGSGAAHRLLAPAGHGVDHRRFTKAAVASLQHRRDAGSRIESRCGRRVTAGHWWMDANDIIVAVRNLGRSSTPPTFEVDSVG